MGGGPALEDVEGVLESDVVERAVVDTDTNGGVVDVLPWSRCNPQGITCKYQEAKGFHHRVLHDATGQGLEGGDGSWCEGDGMAGVRQVV